MLSEIISDWERAVDSYGRVYYIDHENRITTWIRPSAGMCEQYEMVIKVRTLCGVNVYLNLFLASASETSLNEVNHHRQNLDRR